MTNVLIPTDFSLQSLDLVNRATMHIPGKLNITMLHIFDMPSSLSDVTRPGGINGHYNLITEELRNRCRQIRANNANIAGIRFQMMFGTTAAAFRNFAEANAIDIIVYPSDYLFVPVTNSSVDPGSMILRSGIKVLRELSTRYAAFPRVALS